MGAAGFWEVFMALQIPKPAILSRTLRYLAAGGLTLAIAVAQEIAKPDTDWNVVLTTIAGMVIGLGGGAYGRTMAQGPVTSLLPAAKNGAR
jgi:hypothetical protein